MGWIIAVLCALSITACDTPEQIPVEDFASVVAPLPAEYLVEPHRISDKISIAAWVRAMELRPLFMDTVKKEFDNNMMWLGVLVSLAHTESRLRSDVCSPVGACGLMQFMLRTAKAMAATDCRDLGRANRRDPAWSIPCAARLFKQNIRVVKVDHTAGDCNIIGLGVLRPHNEGGGWTNRARARADNPNDINSVAAVSIKSVSNEIQTDQYVVKILKKWMPEYGKSNYFLSGDVCRKYVFNLQGVQL